MKPWTPDTLIVMFDPQAIMYHHGHEPRTSEELDEVFSLASLALDILRDCWGIEARAEFGILSFEPDGSTFTPIDEACIERGSIEYAVQEAVADAVQPGDGALWLLDEEALVEQLRTRLGAPINAPR
jgi:hypothetical protein